MRGREPNSRRVRDLGSGLVRHGMIAGAALALLPGCSDDNPEVLATIGGRGDHPGASSRIRRTDPREPALGRAGAEAMRDHLQSFIDMQLMELEARDQDLHEDPVFRRSSESFAANGWIAELVRRHLDEQEQLTTREVRKRFGESKWSRQLQLAHIELASEAEAQRLLPRSAEGGLSRRSPWRGPGTKRPPGTAGSSSAFWAASTSRKSGFP